MSRFVLDASVVLAWCFPDENNALPSRVADLFKHGHAVVVPSFWPHEVLNGLLAGERRKRISFGLTQSFLQDLAMMPIELQILPTPDVFARIQSLSRQHALTPYDAAYLDLALDRNLHLATLDEALIRACKKEKVKLFTA